MAEIYVSIDIETVGHCPGMHSMVSLGAAAFTPGKEGIVGAFHANVQQVPGLFEDPDTMKWWEQFPEAWAEAQRNPEKPYDALHRFNAFLKELRELRIEPDCTTEPNDLIPVCWPVAYDYPFVVWYCFKYLGWNPFHKHKAIDVESYAAGALALPFRQANTKAIKAQFGDGREHTHKAVDDAIEQGDIFMRLMSLNESRGC